MAAVGCAGVGGAAGGIGAAQLISRRQPSHKALRRRTCRILIMCRGYLSSGLRRLDSLIEQQGTIRPAIDPLQNPIAILFHLAFPDDLSAERFIETIGRCISGQRSNDQRGHAQLRKVASCGLEQTAAHSAPLAIEPYIQGIYITGMLPRPNFGGAAHDNADDLIARFARRCVYSEIDALAWAAAIGNIAEGVSPSLLRHL